jgi:hypothetical protein
MSWSHGPCIQLASIISSIGFKPAVNQQFAGAFLPIAEAIEIFDN